MTGAKKSSKGRKIPLQKKSPRKNQLLKKSVSKKRKPLKRTSRVTKNKKGPAKKRKNKKAPLFSKDSKRTKPTSRSSRFVTTLLLILLVFGGFYLFTLDRKIVNRFEGKRWRLPSKIYSDSFSLYPGCDYKGSGLYERLHRLGYQAVTHDNIKKGQYYLGRGYITLYLHDFLYPHGAFKGFPVRIDVKKGRIKGIVDLRDPSKEIFSLDLEPELITGLFEQVWEQRRLVKLSDVSEYMVKAVIATEDHRFYQHFGFDVRGIIRAMAANIKARRIVQGASTLTQQLVKNFFLTPKRTFTRKIQEAFMAVLLEIRYSKDQILEAYLNEIYFGQKGAQGIYGVGEAAEFYFGKSAKGLTLAESALLAGLIRSPNLYTPHKESTRIRRRRDHVLKRMRELGMIEDEPYQAAQSAPIDVRTFVPERNDAPYFVDYLVRELKNDYSLNILTSEGLLIFTTLDIQMQREATQSVRKGLKRLEGEYPSLAEASKADPMGLQACLVALEPQTGFIRAMVGGRDYKKSQFNRCVQASRQPGSLFKPIVYISAMEGDPDDLPGYTAASIIRDEPIRVRYKGKSWNPHNFKDQYYGDVTLRMALENSLNCATVRLSRELGLDVIIKTARRLGMTTALTPEPSLVLGSLEAQPLEFAALFGAFANHGVLSKPRGIKKVLDKDGRLLDRKPLELRQAVSPQAAYLITHILKGVFKRGTARFFASKVPVPAAGKTGTTNDYYDAWFAGYTPQLSALVWVGFDQPRSLELSGSQAALPIWVDFINRIAGELSHEDFLPPQGIEFHKVDRISGQLATPACTDTIVEAFIVGTAPTEKCRNHAGVYSKGRGVDKRKKGIFRRFFDLFR